jgi:hypothetical protein
MSTWTISSCLPSGRILHIVWSSRMTSLVSGLVISSSDFWHTLSSSLRSSGLSSSPTLFQSFILLRMCFHVRHPSPSTLLPMSDERMERHLNGDGQRLMLWPTARRKWVRDLDATPWMITLVTIIGGKCHRCVSRLLFSCARGY